MITSIASQKGGTGKTSTTISLSAGLARKGTKVLLVDIDSQANSSKVLLHDYQKILKEQTLYTTIIECNPLPIHTTHVPNLSIVPSHILLSNTDIELTTAKDHREKPSMRSASISILIFRFLDLFRCRSSCFFSGAGQGWVFFPVSGI